MVFQLVFQLLGPLEHLLGRLEVVPEIRVPGFFLQLLHLPAGPLQVQGLGQVLQSGGQIVQLYLIFIKLEHFVPTLSN